MSDLKKLKKYIFFKFSVEEKMVFNTLKGGN